MDERQTEMALLPPRVEDQALSPRTQPGQGLSIDEFVRPAFNSAVERFRSAGNLDIDPEDPAVYNAFRRSMDYLGDMALGGVDLSDAAFRSAIGIVAQALPEDQERRFARDMAGMPEAFLGVSPGRIAAAADTVAAGFSQAGRRVANIGRRATATPEEDEWMNVDFPDDFEGEVLPDTPRPAVQTPPRSKINPLFRSASPPREENTLVNFYSPLRSAVMNMPVARDGSTGETIMAYLNKRAPNVSSSELNFSNLNLDPSRRYTREDVLSLIERDTSNFRSNLLSGRDTLYRKQQRQNIADPEEAYFEITLDSPNLQAHRSHFFPETFAHSRSSIRRDSDGDYILIEELQSDPLQGVDRNYIPTNETFDAERDQLFDNLQGDLEFENVFIKEDLLDSALGDMFNPQGTLQELKEWYSETQGIDANGYTRWSVHMDAIRQSTPDNLTPEVEDRLLQAFDEARELGSSQTRILSESDVPFTSNTQYVRNLILSNIAAAKNEGISRIVIPPVEEIARLRANTGAFPDMESAIKALRPTYVDAVRKAVNTLNNEANGTIRVGTQPLEYPTALIFERGQPTRSATGTLLDISDFDFDPQTQAARFAEGGAVTMERQMELFEEGGLRDDGTRIDPVSGNEVPPGSMAKEVRDDVPAQLSEGEYVIPADVVRYYGVKFFEDLRMGAKQGLSSMEQNGRIGGEPVDPTPGDGPLSEEEMMMLAEISGMYRGGQVKKGYADGGLEEQVSTPNPLPNVGFNYLTPGSSAYMNNQTTTGTTTADTAADTTTADEEESRVVTLFGPDGNIVPLLLPEEQARYDALIGEGYSEEQTVRTQSGNDNGGGGGGGGGGGAGEDADRRSWAEKNYEALSTDLEGFVQGRLDRVQNLGGLTAGGVRLGLAAAGPLGGALVGGASGIAQASSYADIMAASLIAEAQGKPELAAQFQSQAQELYDSMSGAGRTFVSISNLLTGTPAGYDKFESFMNADPSTFETPLAPAAPSVQLPGGNGGGGGGGGAIITPSGGGGGQPPSVDPNRTSTPPSTQGVMDALRNMQSDRDNDPIDDSFSRQESARQQAAQNVAASEGTTTSSGGISRTDDAGKETYSSKVSRGGGFQKGGLIQKPQKRRTRKSRK